LVKAGALSVKSLLHASVTRRFLLENALTLVNINHIYVRRWGGVAKNWSSEALLESDVDTAIAIPVLASLPTYGE
jgi:hypothetical protein